MSQTLRLVAPAKINLHLRVAPPTADGFHPLLSWMCTVGLFDTLSLRGAVNQNASSSPARDGNRSGSALSHQGSESHALPANVGADASLACTAPVVSPQIVLTCDDPTLACDEKNLVVRAGMALAGAAPMLAPHGRVCDVIAHLEKCIPMGGGLGGGSSDGARMLLGLNQFWQLGLDRTTLARIAATLGSDMPFFCHPCSGICTGRGEIVRPIDPPKPRWVLLMLPQIHMPTPTVYRQFDQMGLGSVAAVASEPDWNAWLALPARELLLRLVNDLEAPAFALRPDLLDCRNLLEEVLGRRALMSGSGSSLFTLYDQADEVQAAERQLADQLTGRLNGVHVIAAELAPKSCDDLL